MAGSRHHSLLHCLRQMLGSSANAAVSDTDLLRRFVDQGDEAAFELLLWRHAAMVLHVCRQVLGDADAAEDALQATFLVLMRKAGSISRRESLGAWLYRVAFHTALKARAEMRKRRNAERQAMSLDWLMPSDSAVEREQQQIIAEEVHRLPVKFRAAIVACYFEAKSLEEAAHQLGWPRGTVASRLSRGRELLRRRLLGRGIALTVGALSMALAAPLSAATLTKLIRATIPIMKRFAVGDPIPPRIDALAEGVLQTMKGTRMKKIVMIVLLLAGLGGMGTTFWAAAPKRAEPPSESAPPAKASGPNDKNNQPDEAAKRARDMAQSRLNLRKLALAMHAYSDANMFFLPPPALINKDGKAVLSWRVLLLPYLGERDLYEQFKLSEPWDSAHNKKLLSKMPAVYAPPGVKTREPFSTYYQIFVSPKPKDGRMGAEVGGPLGVEIQAAFVEGQPQSFPTHFSDGVSNTILIAEAGKAVPWTKPEDLPYAADAPVPELGGLFPGSFHTAFASGTVYRLTTNNGEYYLRRLITSNDGQPIFFDPVLARSAAAELRSKKRELQQELDDAQDGLRLLHEERDALQGRAGKAKRPRDEDSHLDELKRENARLQKELDKLREEIRDLDADIRQRLRKQSK